jgi:hypothetical protein
MRSIRIYIFFLAIFPLTINPQPTSTNGTFLQYSNLEGTLVGLAPQIQVTDIDDDLNNEIMILVPDTLFILNEGDIQKYYAFEPTSSSEPNLWGLIYCKGVSQIGRLYSVGYEFSNLFWSSYEPITGNWNYGELDYYHSGGLSTSADGKIWMSIYELSSQGLLILRMTDLVSQPDTITYIGEGDSLVQFASGTISYTPIFMSSNGQYISTIHTGDNLFTSGHPGGVYHYFSTDYGSTWRGESIARGHLYDPVFGQVSNRNLAPYLVMISTFSGAVDNNGVLHFSILGLGLTTENTDTTELTTILYWNSRDQEWLAITNPSYESDYDGAGNHLRQYCPGIAIGQSIPSLAVSEDGSVVMVTWTAPEYVGEPGISSYNIYPGDGGPYSTPLYYTDILANISFDGGRTWQAENVFPLKNKKNSSEVDLSLNQKLRFDENGNLIADYFYMIDAVPGWYGWQQNSESDSNMWFYDYYPIILTSKNDNIVTLDEYRLEQNYPNPFNPITNIQYQIPELNFVTLKVYDVLGNEIATLVNEENPAGSYKVKFDGAELASGIYFYRLQAGSFFETKKMVLMK